MDRLGRADFAFSMTLDWNYDADKNTMVALGGLGVLIPFNDYLTLRQVEADAYHCTSGDESDYKLMPFSIPKQPFFEYLNAFYKDAFIKNVGHCSNLIQFEGEFTPPWPRGVYKLDKCVASGEGLPEVVPEGYYKIVYNTTGQVTWGFIFVVRVTQKVI